MLHWNDVDPIVELLEEMYADEDIPEGDLPYLREMIFSIDEFEDQEVDVDESHLKIILEAWIEYRNQ